MRFLFRSIHKVKCHYFALLRLISLIFLPLLFSLVLICTHFPLHTLMQLLQSHVQPYLRLLQSKSYTESQRYLPPNLDYESDNSIFSASSGISTSFSGLSFFQYYEFFLIIRPRADFFLTTKNSWHREKYISFFTMSTL